MRIFFFPTAVYWGQIMSAYKELSSITKRVSRPEDFVITRIYCSGNESRASWARIYCIWKGVSLRNRSIIVRKNVVLTHICVETRCKNSCTVRGKYCKFTFTLFSRIAAALFPQLRFARSAFFNGFMVSRELRIGKKASDRPNRP